MNTEVHWWDCVHIVLRRLSWHSASLVTVLWKYYCKCNCWLAGRWNVSTTRVEGVIMLFKWLTFYVWISGQTEHTRSWRVRCSNAVDLTKREFKGINCLFCRYSYLIILRCSTALYDEFWASILNKPQSNPVQWLQINNPLILFPFIPLCCIILNTNEVLQSDSTLKYWSCVLHVSV